MSIETLERLFIILNSLPQQKVRTNWHGGEPLLAGRKFFNHIVRLESQFPEKMWVNSIQTNATLIDSPWAKFFHDNCFNIGVSIDGSEQTHNANRVDIADNGTYKKVIYGVNVLRQHNINPSAICTVTKKSVTRGREMFLSLVDAGFKSIAFNAFYNTASSCDSDTYGLTDQEWLMFLIDIFEAWIALNDPSIRVRELDGIIAWLKEKSANSCVYKGTCYQWFVVDYTGDIFPCERFGRTIHFGNIYSLVDFQGVLDGQIFLDWKGFSEQLPKKCLACNLQTLCHNGCRSHRTADCEGGIPLYAYCESRRGFYNYLTNRLRGKEVNSDVY